MLRGNLSTRPFYNERLVSLVVILGTLAGLALAVFNGTQIVQLSSERTRQRAELDRIEADATKSRTTAASLQQTLDQSNLRVLAAATGEANDLIDQRTFSWTEFFGIVEKTLPLDARLIAVAPRVDRSVFMIVMQLNVKRVEDLEAFVDALLATGTFFDLLPGNQQLNDDGTLAVTLQGGYLAPSGTAPVRRGTVRP